MSINNFMRAPQQGNQGFGSTENSGFFGYNEAMPDTVAFDPGTLDEAAYAEQREVADLAQAMIHDEDTVVDSEGTIRLQVEGTPLAENVTRVDGNIFGAPTAEEEEAAQLAQAFHSDMICNVDKDGIIHIGNDATQENMTRVDGNKFGRPTAEEEEAAQLAQAFHSDMICNVDKDGIIHIGNDATQENMTRVDGNKFGQPLSEEEEVSQIAQAIASDDDYWVDEFGRIRLGSDPNAGVNMTKVDGNVFGAHEDQWYNRNPQLFRAETATMRQRHPQAGYNFYKTNGNMYWIIKVKVMKADSVKPWTFQLVYDKDHPHNHGFGGSIKVVPLQPSLDDLQRIASQHNRPGVPHVIYNQSHFLKRYLCTRWPKDIASGEELIASATQAVAWAADWAAHFEVGIRDKRAWNKWCDDDHFRHMQVK